MHSYLRETIERFRLQFDQDGRVAAMYLFGSGGKGADDEYSDADVGIVIRDESYEELRDELKDICERLCGRIHLWFPEGERSTFCNYAFLFEANDEQFLYDFTIMSEAFFKEQVRQFPGKVIFDKANLSQTGEAGSSNAGYSPDKLIYSIQQYWIYTYLNGKYFKRKDIFKLLYIQNFLFTNHMQLLHALHPNESWNWWASDIKKLPDAKQSEMLVYFGAKSVDEVTAALEQELVMFADDARKACEKWEMSYPQELEEYVRRHLRTMGVIKQA